MNIEPSAPQANIQPPNAPMDIQEIADLKKRLDSLEEENNVLKMELRQKTPTDTNDNTDDINKKQAKIEANSKRIEEITEILGKRKREDKGGGAILKIGDNKNSRKLRRRKHNTRKLKIGKKLKTTIKYRRKKNDTRRKKIKVNTI